MIIARSSLLIGLALLLSATACQDKPKSSGRAQIVEPVFQPVSELGATRVSFDLRDPKPLDPRWGDVPGALVTLMAQPMVAPRPERTTTETLTVQAAHDGERLALRFVWKDPERSEAGHLAEFSDAVAIQFPVSGEASTPVMMGTKGLPVHIYHWRAQYQQDEQQGAPDMTKLYPNLSVDMYPVDPKEAPGGTQEEKDVFQPARALGNPQSQRKLAVDEIVAEGFSTSQVQPNQGSKAHGEWVDGYWKVVIVRPLENANGSSVKLGGTTQAAFAVWQGGESEVGSRKCVTMSWLPVKVSP